MQPLKSTEAYHLTQTVWFMAAAAAGILMRCRSMQYAAMWHHTEILMSELFKTGMCGWWQRRMEFPLWEKIILRVIKKSASTCQILLYFTVWVFYVEEGKK